MLSDAEYLELVDAAAREAEEEAESEEGWRVEKEDGDCIVQMKKNKAGRKVKQCNYSFALRQFSTPDIPVPGRGRNAAISPGGGTKGYGMIYQYTSVN